MVKTVELAFKCRQESLNLRNQPVPMTSESVGVSKNCLNYLFMGSIAYSMKNIYFFLDLEGVIW
jgi:hypothetical protein